MHIFWQLCKPIATPCLMDTVHTPKIWLVAEWQLLLWRMVWGNSLTAFCHHGSVAMLGGLCYAHSADTLQELVSHWAGVLLHYITCCSQPRALVLTADSSNNNLLRLLKLIYNCQCSSYDRYSSLQIWLPFISVHTGSKGKSACGICVKKIIAGLYMWGLIWFIADKTSATQPNQYLCIYNIKP